MSDLTVAVTGPTGEIGRAFLKALDPHARVLVHCVQGISRSATVVAAYLMATKGLTPIAAVTRVKELRHCANPNEGFRSQLLEYEQCLLKTRARDHYAHHAHPYRLGRGELR